MWKRLIDAREFRGCLALFMAFEAGVWIGMHQPMGWAEWTWRSAAIVAAGLIAQ